MVKARRSARRGKRMSGSQRFLTAEWKNLVMLNYAVDRALLERFVPAGTELDAHQGEVYVSLIGFQFKRTCLLGWRIPFHQDFEEVNLRFYVRRGLKRGVVFVREFVPKFAVAVIARIAYNEKYSCVPMSHRIEAHAGGNAVEAEYVWGSRSDRCSMRIESEGRGLLPPEGSLGQFISEHYWGYAAQRAGGCVEYEVQHERWPIRPTKLARFSGNAAGFYGAEFAEVLMRTPDSAFMADGSPVTVSKGTRIC